jgi:hypothetical protein
MGRKAGVTISTTSYDKFRGADFTTDPSLVEKYRSPLCTNIIADEGGMPEKRPGWRVLQDMEDPVNGLHRGTFNGAEVLLVHAGTKLYTWTEDPDTPPVQILTGMANARSRSVFLSGKLWIIDGASLISFDGSTAERVDGTNSYVPTILISRAPAGGGTPYEDVNLLSPWRTESFLADGTSTVYHLSGTVDAGTDPTVTVNGTVLSTGYSFDRAAGTVTFSTAPAAPLAGSADNVQIQYSHTVSGYADMIGKCTILTSYGISGDDRLVLSGNPDWPNRDWISAYNEPTYFPDLGYSVLGSEDTAIAGYCRVGQYQAIVKSDNGQESTIYLRSGYLNEEGEAVFTTQAAMAGVGAVSPGSFAALLDDPLFLSGTGIHAISVSNMTGSRVTQNRSYFLNPRLQKETLGSAEAVSWNGLYLLSIGNGHVYVLDGRQEKSYRSAAMSDFVYEAYYWENIPAACWLKRETAQGEELYFGTADGKICKINSDVAGMNRYADNSTDEEHAVPISAVWATKYDDDGTPSYFKTLLKKGCCVTIKPYARSSATVYFRTDKTAGTEQEIASDLMDIFSWDYIDFERFSFNTDDSPQEIYFAKKVKNYKRLQIVIRNDEINEGFGVYQITKHFVVGNFSKRRR